MNNNMSERSVVVTKKKHDDAEQHNDDAEENNDYADGIIVGDVKCDVPYKESFTFIFLLFFPNSVSPFSSYLYPLSCFFPNHFLSLLFHCAICLIHHYVLSLIRSPSTTFFHLLQNGPRIDSESFFHVSQEASTFVSCFVQLLVSHSIIF